MPRRHPISGTDDIASTALALSYPSSANIRRDSGENFLSTNWPACSNDTRPTRARADFEECILGTFFATRPPFREQRVCLLFLGTAS
ncbi:hypothetical protein MRX96_038050 [Rhipicephalus microplus]